MDKTSEEVINFLIENEISFTVPGCYTLDTELVKDAVSEFIKIGQSNLIENDKKYTYLSWNFSNYIEYDGYGCIFMSLKDLEELKRLKILYNDLENLEDINYYIKIEKVREKNIKSYKYKRKKGFTQSLKNECKNRDNYSCVKCGSIEHLEIDHIIELIDGGKNELDNLQTLCRKCHRIKTNKNIKKRKCPKNI